MYTVCTVCNNRFQIINSLRDYFLQNLAENKIKPSEFDELVTSSLDELKEKLEHHQKVRDLEARRGLRQT